MAYAERLTAAKSEYTKQLKQIGNVSFSIWLLNRAESAEAEHDNLQARLNAIHSEYDELRLVRESETSRADALHAENAELRRQLEQATDLISRLDKAAFFEKSLQDDVMYWLFTYEVEL